MPIISSMLAFPASANAQLNPLSKNRIFPKNEAIKENHPLQRKHPYGGTLVIGVHTAPEIINPILTQTSISASLMELIFDSGSDVYKPDMLSC